jgi:hypothetical protein
MFHYISKCVGNFFFYNFIIKSNLLNLRLYKVYVCMCVEILGWPSGSRKQDYFSGLSNTSNEQIISDPPWCTPLITYLNSKSIKITHLLTSKSIGDIYSFIFSFFKMYQSIKYNVHHARGLQDIEQLVYFYVQFDPWPQNQ